MNLTALRGAFGLLTFAVCLLGSAFGCWPLRVDPETEDVCPRRPNCGICASDELCAWVASEDETVRACYPRSDVGDRAPQVRVLEACPDSELGELPPR